MKKYFHIVDEKTFAYIIYTVALLIANLTANRICLWWGFTFSGNPLSFVSCLFICDLINEKYGEKEAQNIVNVGFVAMVVFLVFIYTTYLFPATDFSQDMDRSFKMVFDNNYRIVIGSFAAYLLSNHIDIKIFAKIRKVNDSKLLRKMASTFISQFVDGFVFCAIAFLGVFTIKEIVGIFISEYIFKAAMNCIDTPLYMLFTKNKKNVIS